MAQARSGARGSDGDGRAGHIGPGTRIRGRVSGDGNLTVEGHLEGDVTLRGELTVTASGTVTAGAVEVDLLVVSGAVEADMRVSGRVHALAGSRVRGNVQGLLALDEGAEFAGRIENDFALPAELEGAAARDPRRR